MAKDGLTLKLEGGARLDQILSKLDPNQSKRIIDSSLKKAGQAVRDTTKSLAPVARNPVYKDPSKMGSRGGKVVKSRPHPLGTLRRSIKSRLSGRARPNSKTFIASVYVQDGHKNKAANYEDGWYAHFVTRGFHNNRKNDFMKRGARASKGKFKSIMEVQMLKKITKAQQKILNTLK
jgi:HK97 gp10 family phage protein